MEIFVHSFNSNVQVALILVLFEVNYLQPLLDLMKYIIKCKLPIIFDSSWLFECNYLFV